MASPLLEDAGISGARGLLISITGSSQLGLHDVHEATSEVQKIADPEANIIFGAVQDESMGAKVKITVVATGFRNEGIVEERTATAESAAASAEIRQMLQQAAAARGSLSAVPEPEETEPAPDEFPRTESAEGQAEESTLTETEPDDLEKPAYLRRQIGFD